MVRAVSLSGGEVFIVKSSTFSYNGVTKEWSLYCKQIRYCYSIYTYIHIIIYILTLVMYCAATAPPITVIGRVLIAVLGKSSVVNTHNGM